MNTVIIQPGKSPGCGVGPWWLLPDFETEKKASLGKAEREGVKRVLHRRLAGGQTRQSRGLMGVLGQLSSVGRWLSISARSSEAIFPTFRCSLVSFPLLYVRILISLHSLRGSAYPHSSSEDSDLPPLIAWFWAGRGLQRLSVNFTISREIHPPYSQSSRVLPWVLQVWEMVKREVQSGCSFYCKGLGFIVARLWNNHKCPVNQEAQHQRKQRPHKREYANTELKNAGSTSVLLPN